MSPPSGSWPVFATRWCRPIPVRSRSPPRSARSACRATRATPTRRSTAPMKRSMAPSAAAPDRSRWGVPMSSATPSAAPISAPPPKPPPGSRAPGGPRVLELVVAGLAAAPKVQLSLNISPDTTMDPDWWASIESLMRAHPGVAERLIVEITETVAIQDIDDLRGFVTRLKNFGSRIAIDDFGAGYTSFRNLRKLGVDIVKIDGAFVQNIARSADDRAFVQTLIDLARRLDIKTVAEWVQDEESASMLRDWGCDYIQGRLIGLASSDRPWQKPAEAELPAGC